MTAKSYVFYFILIHIIFDVKLRESTLPRNGIPSKRNRNCKHIGVGTNLVSLCHNQQDNMAIVEEVRSKELIEQGRRKTWFLQKLFFKIIQKI